MPAVDVLYHVHWQEAQSIDAQSVELGSNYGGFKFEVQF